MTRSLFAVLLSALLLSSAAPQAAAQDPAASQLVYIGTYTNQKSKGIYFFRLDPATGQATKPQLAAETRSPSFLALHPTGRFLYAVGEVNSFDNKPGGAVTAFSISPDGALTQLNHQSSGGAGPCHISIDSAGKNALVANYGGGSVSAIPIAEDGKLKAPTAFVQHSGSSVNPQRQKAPHAHSINLDKANRFAFVADLGLDKVLVYRFDSAAGTLSPNNPPAANVTPGGGPRHFAFHPSGKFAYSNLEMTSAVTAFSYDADKGALTELHTVPTLPADFDAKKNSTAEIQVHPSGKFLYVSNRGHDSIAIFSIDETTGKLTPAGHQSTQGKTPRNFGIDPTGNWLLAANQGSDTVVIFQIDPQTGALKPTGATVEVPTPVCVRLLATPPR